MPVKLTGTHWLDQGFVVEFCSLKYYTHTQFFYYTHTNHTPSSAIKSNWLYNMKKQKTGIK